ncbi:arrestin domain-containing protein 17-like [Phthorimaea operculella]|nr:arrestin domain-containing protein 17-like [Phthorimaea operculella]
MGFDDGKILFQSENGIFYAGDAVRGKVVFDQQKNKNFRGMYAKLKGVCEVRWTTRHTRRINDRTEHYTKEHTSHETYVDKKIYLIGGPSGDVQIQPGHHEYPFEFIIPHECPPSFEGRYGHIRYTVKVVIDRAFKFDQEKKVEIRVVNQKDLNRDPYCKELMHFAFEESYCCWCASQGNCETEVKLPQSGYCPGQTINFDVKCANNSRVRMDGITFEIKETKKYIATHNSDTKYEENVIARLRKGPIPGNTTRNWMLEMEIPQMDLYNLDACSYIDIRYDFKVKIIASGCHSNTKASRRLVLGHIPLREFENNPQGDQIVAQPVAPSMMQFPGANAPYLDEKPPYPGGIPGIPYPGSIPPYPDSVPPPYPGENPPYPGGNPPYPAGNPPYPLSNPFPPLPGVSPYPVGGDPVAPGFKMDPTSPLLPSVTPYPSNQPIGSSYPNAAPSAPPPGTPDIDKSAPFNTEVEKK